MSRVSEYLLRYYQNGHPLRAEGFLPLITLAGPQLEKAMDAFTELGPGLLRPVFDALNGAVGYEDLKVLRLRYLSLRNPAGRAEDGARGKQSHAAKLVCLANSRKYSGRCVAGKKVLEGAVGEWIRPVSREATGELSPDDILLPTGDMPQLLDIVTVPLQAGTPRTYQSENHLIRTGRWGW